MLILPSALRSKIDIIRQSKGLTNVAPNAFINIAKELLANMTQSEVDETMGHTAPVSSASVTTLPSTMASKWASNPVSNAIIPIQHGSTSKVVKPVAPPVGRGQSTSHNSNNSYPSTGSTAKKYCSYHKSRAHNTNECNAYDAVLAANNVADHSARPPLPCPDCDSPNYVEGHQCSTASRNGPPPSAPEHRFRMMQIAEPSTTVVNALTTTPSAPPKRYCTFHKSNKHSTNNCRAFAEHLQALESEISSNSHQSAPARALAHVSAPSASLTASPATTKIDDDLNNDSMDVDAIIASAAQR